MFDPRSDKLRKIKSEKLNAGSIYRRENMSAKYNPSSYHLGKE